MSDGRLTALVAGGTGIVGREVVGLLSQTPAYRQTLVLTRREIDPPAGGIEPVLVDFEGLCQGESLPQADHVFICLGTTQRIAGSQDAFRRVDLDYVSAVARAAREAGATRLALISSVGASATARNFYLRVKGEAEEAVKALGYERIVIAQPGLLRGPRDNDKRLGESVAKVAAPVMDALLFGSLRQFRSIFPDVVAQALVSSVRADGPAVEVMTYDGLMRWASSQS
jgi:uncharacterized protein YbjT (DUF2867 family)